jgi:hypothetical protein
MADLGTATTRIVPKTGELEQELDHLELQVSRIQTRLDAALWAAQTLRGVLQQCETLTSQIEEKQ